MTKSHLLKVMAAGMLLASCSAEKEMNEISNQIPFNPVIDVLNLKYLNSENEELLALDESSSRVTDQSVYQFYINRIVDVTISDDLSCYELTSYYGKTIKNLDIYAYIKEVDKKVLVARIDSIAGFSKTRIYPAFLSKEAMYKVDDNRYVSLQRENISPEMEGSVESSDSGFVKLRQIKAQWRVGFSNFGWTPEIEGHNWNEMSPIYAREWIAIMTNLGAMLSSDEFYKMITNFSQVMGGPLIDNNKTELTAQQYKDLLDKYLAPHNFNLGRVTTSNVNGLGGGSTLGITHYNFYSHYACYSGWETIVHELGHCKGYSHDSNMTYPTAGSVSLPHMVQEFSAYSKYNDIMVYDNRDILGFHHEDNRKYLKEGFDSGKMNDAKTLQFYQTSRVKKFLDANK